MNIAWHFPSQLLPFFWAGAMVLHMAVGPYRQTVRPWGWWWCVCGWPNHRGHVEKCMVDHWWDLRRYSLCSILARGLARMPKRSTKHSFSYSAPCVGYWEGNRCLRKLALQHQLLLKDAEGEKIIKVSLQKHSVQLPHVEGVHKGHGRKWIYLDQPDYLPQAPDSSFLWANGSRLQSSGCQSSDPWICKDCPTHAYYGKTEMDKMGTSKSSWDSINKFWNIYYTNTLFTFIFGIIFRILKW